MTGQRSHALTTRAAACEEDGTGRGTPIVTHGGVFDGAVAFTKAKRAQSATDDESWVPGDVAPTQNQFDQGDTRATTVVAFKESQSGCRLGNVHATLDSNKGSRRVEGVMTPMAVRRLTPRECERLQGFPDDYTAIEYRKKPAADGPKYRALGNSMAVPCMWWLGYRIAKATDADNK